MRLQSPEAIEIFQTVQPFPHLVVDDMWSDTDLGDVLAEFPTPDDLRWRTYNDRREVGKKAGDRTMQGPATRRFLQSLRQPPFLCDLEILTGIDGLVGDEYGGGLHLTGEGGRLGMHTDFQVHPSLPGLQRRINLLVFLVPRWKASWGGTLYLGEHCEAEIVPAWNRTVIFETSGHSWHGHPDPIIGDHVRRSLAMYYYAPVIGEPLAGSTIWQERG